ncbi:hypothetical protein GEMRC1_006460 [Eukaryota sp. GEM-RC1]
MHIPSKNQWQDVAHLPKSTPPDVKKRCGRPRRLRAKPLKVRKRLLKDAKQPEATQKDPWEANDLWLTSDAVEASFSVPDESEDTDWCPEDVFLSSEDSTDIDM